MVLGQYDNLVDCARCRRQTVEATRAIICGWRRSGVAIRGPKEDHVLGNDGLDGFGAARHVVRFGKKLKGDDVPTVPLRYRGGPGGPAGRLVAARLHPATGEAWLRLRPSDAPWQSEVRTIPLNASQSPAPTPDTLELRGGTRIRCHDGYVGRLEGMVLDNSTGAVQELIIRVRSNVLADVETNVDPMNALLRVAGQQVLVPPAWAISTTRENSNLPFRGGATILLLDASPEQIASGTVLRADAALAGDILAIWNDNPALVPYASQIQVVVRDGKATLLGTVPSPRHRATAEQDAWHVPGVFAVSNEMIVHG